MKAQSRRKLKGLVNMHKFILRRLLMLIPVMLGVSFIVFSMLHLAPGDPAVTIAGEHATLEQIEAIRESMGLNDPFLVQYGRWLGNAVIHQDLGVSRANHSVVDELMSRFPATLQLAGAAVLVSVVIGLPIGIISATKQYSIFDNVSMLFALLGVSMPNFWQGMLLMLLFALNLGWLPFGGLPGGADNFVYLILPAITLGTSSAAVVARMTRSSMLEVIRQDYIKTARAKGQTERIITTRHALKNALIPIITVVGLNFGFMLGGAVITEMVFTIPGIGSFMVNAIQQRDFPVVQGGVLFVALTFTVVNLAVDILYAFVDPRIKSQYR